MPSTTAPEAPPAEFPHAADARLDAFVDRARAAADQFRSIDDQATVDRIVRALRGPPRPCLWHLPAAHPALQRVAAD